MATVEANIKTLLAALVSGRAYPLVAPDCVEKPYIVFQVVDDVMVNSLDGYTGQSNKRMQIDCYATTYGAAKTLAESVKTNMAAAAEAGTINNLHLSNRELYEDEVKLYRVSMDFSIWN